jgi:hypothetical protein
VKVGNRQAPHASNKKPQLTPVGAFCVSKLHNKNQRTKRNRASVARR